VQTQIGEELKRVELPPSGPGAVVGTPSTVAQGFVLPAVLKALEGDRRVKQVPGEAHHFFGGRGVGADGVVDGETRVSPGEHPLDLFWRESLSSFHEAENPGLKICLGCRWPGKGEWGDLSMPIGYARRHETMQVGLKI